jgi:glycine betaine/choline ABC-type transport system substrate-binding protein
MRKLFFYFALLLLIMGCSKKEPLHIGSKDFTEQHILAEIIAQLLEYEKIPVKRSIPYGDTFSNLEAIKNGELDLYVEYNGTGLIMLGQPPISNGDKAFAEVKKLFHPLGLEWMNRLGFSNDYVLVMRRDRALALKINKISDLVKIQPNLRMAMESEFVERPLDGLPALQRRYGLTHIVSSVVDNNKAVIYQALLDGKVDVTEGFATEGRIEDFGLAVLEDDLAFFPVYEPSPLVRKEALKRYPKLRSVLEKLADLINTTDMRQMNRKVELEGQDYQRIAQEFLIKHKLIEKQLQTVKSDKLIVSAGLINELGGSISQAVRAIRKTFPGRRIKVLQTADPLQAILDGKARLGILSAEFFFKMGDEVLPKQNKSVEAVGVIGTRMAHIIVRQDSRIKRLKDIKRLGVGALNSASDRTAKMVLTSLDWRKDIQLVNNEKLALQLDELNKRKLDGLFLMVPPGHEKLTMIMNEGTFKLLSLKSWQEGNHLIRFPFFRLARIPANTYEQQPELIETISTQMVLAGPTPVTKIVGDRGPATVISSTVQPLSDPLTLQLNKALSSGEKLDPAIPAAEVLTQRTKPLSNPINPSAMESLFNLLIIFMIILFFYLFLRKEKAV